MAENWGFICFRGTVLNHEFTVYGVHESLYDNWRPCHIRRTFVDLLPLTIMCMWLSLITLIHLVENLSWLVVFHSNIRT